MKSEEIKNQEYKYGFTTEIDNFKAPKGLSESTIRFISKIKKRTQMDVGLEIKSYSIG